MPCLGSWFSSGVCPLAEARSPDARLQFGLGMRRHIEPICWIDLMAHAPKAFVAYWAPAKFSSPRCVLNPLLAICLRRCIATRNRPELAPVMRAIAVGTAIAISSDPSRLPARDSGKKTTGRSQAMLTTVVLAHLGALVVSLVVLHIVPPIPTTDPFHI